jgi:3-dehydroquinate dehydratase type I
MENLKLGQMPLIACAINDAEVMTVGEDCLNNADLIELRVDMFKDTEMKHIEEIFNIAKEKFKKSIIATVRDVKEGGQKELADRLDIYKTVIPLSDLIDIEINSEDAIVEVKKLCRNYKKILIGSYHNFEIMPDIEFLDNIFLKGKSLGADIIKIAVVANNNDDLTRLVTFTLKHRSEGLITMAMGDIGLPSRVINPIFGSLITYGYVNKPSAPGQLSIRELMDIFKLLKIR